MKAKVEYKFENENELLVKARTKTRKELLDEVECNVEVQEASQREDQRGKFIRRNSIMDAMEKKFYSAIIEELKRKRFNIIINPRMLVSERKNPIEDTYEILEVIGVGGYGEVKKVRHKELDVIRALKTISK